MDVKVCYKCRRELPVTDFKRHAGRADGLQADCIECQQEYRKEHYRRNKEKYLAKAKSSTARNEEWVREYKRKSKCELCGESHPACLQFHHLDPNEKEGNVSWVAHTGCSLTKLMEEVAKCQVLCANCHFKLHDVSSNEIAGAGESVCKTDV
jgi:hypothetical protein